MVGTVLSIPLIIFIRTHHSSNLIYEPDNEIKRAEIIVNRVVSILYIDVRFFNLTGFSNCKIYNCICTSTIIFLRGFSPHLLPITKSDFWYCFLLVFYLTSQFVLLQQIYQWQPQTSPSLRSENWVAPRASLVNDSFLSEPKKEQLWNASRLLAINLFKPAPTLVLSPRIISWPWYLEGISKSNGPKESSCNACNQTSVGTIC